MQFRPPCPASERLLVWRPPKSQLNLDDDLNPLPIPESTIKKLELVLQKSLAPSTIETYGAGLAAFHAFCDHNNIPEESRAPTPSRIVQLFAATLAGFYAQSTVINYLAALRAWHIIHGLPYETDKPTMDSILRATQKLAPPSSTRPQRQPLRIATIEAIKPLLDQAEPLDAAVFACLTTTFWCASRLGEFTVKKFDKYDASKSITRAQMHTQRIEHLNITQYVFHLPWTKTSPNGEEVFWSPQPGNSDPLSAMENHLTTNNPDPNVPLFSYRINKGPHKGSLKPLTKTAFLKRINSALKAAALPHLKGHSIRIGAVLELLLRGATFEAVKAKGRWKSDAFTRYLRAHAEILAPYMHDNINFNHGLHQHIPPPNISAAY